MTNDKLIMMKKYISILPGIALVLLGLNACKSTQKTAAVMPGRAGKTLSKDELFSKIASNEVKADWLSGDLDLDYKGKPMNVGASGTARHRKDSVIWLNVRKFGLVNVARAQITKDSFFLINYIQNNYIAQDLNYVTRKYNLPASFDVLQNLLLGNPVWLVPKSALTIRADSDGNVVLEGADARWQSVHVVDPVTYQVKEMTFKEIASGKSLNVVFSKYGALSNGQIFPFNRLFTVQSPETGEVKLSFNVTGAPEVNTPKNIRFEIPAHYAKME